MTNTYCLQGIENGNLAENYGIRAHTNFNAFAGMESVVNVFEEILLWPSKYHGIFSHSPLRNQAGILLFGPPGTGCKFAN